MTGLPHALRRWAETLGHLPPPLVEAIAPWLGRLDVALGGLDRQGRHGRGEPDGVAGLSRRGDPESLLLSEWLLADEAPLEFLRRAAMGEQLHQERAYRGETAERRWTVLLDGGPAQWGGARLVQLATLVVLAARAQEAGAVLEWGLLQGSWLQRDMDRASWRRWRNERAPLDPEAADLARWQEQLRPAPPRPGAVPVEREVFVVGGPAIESAPPAWLRLHITEPVAPGERELGLAITRRGAAPRRLALPAPPPELSLRVFRDAEPLLVRPRRFVASGNWVRGSMAFRSSGKQLFLRLGDGQLLVIHIPPLPSHTPPNPVRVRLPPSQQLVAAGFWDRRVALVVIKNGAAWLEYAGRRGGHVAESVQLKGDVTLRPCREGPVPGLYRVKKGNGAGLWFLDGADHVHRISDGVVIAERGAAMGLLAQARPLWWTEAAGPMGVDVWTSEAGLARQLLQLPGNRWRVLIGPPLGHAHQALGWAMGLAERAEEGSATRRVDMQFGVPVRWELPARFEPMGLTSHRVGMRVKVVGLDVDTGEVALLAPGECHTLFPPCGPGAEVAVSPTEGWVARITTTGELVVRDPELGAPLLSTLLRESRT